MIKKVDWNDKKTVLTAVQQNGCDLQYASAKLRNDKKVVLTAVQQNGLSLEYAIARFRNDKDVVLAAVQQNGYALLYASEELKNDKEVVLAAVQQDGWVLQFASEELKNDKEFIVELIKKTLNKEILYYVGENIDILEKCEILYILLKEIDAQENLFELSNDATSDEAEKIAPSQPTKKQKVKTYKKNDKAH